MTWRQSASYRILLPTSSPRVRCILPLLACIIAGNTNHRHPSLFLLYAFSDIRPSHSSYSGSSYRRVIDRTTWVRRPTSSGVSYSSAYKGICPTIPRLSWGR